MKTALIVVDIQKYFIKGQTKHLPKKIKDYIIENKFDFIAFTKFINNKKSNFAKSLGWYRCRGSPDTDIPRQLLKFARPSNVFEKSTFSAFKNKKLVNTLRQRRIKRLYICGTDSDACVLASAFDAFDLGFEIIVLKDLCASCNGNRYHEYGKQIIERNLESLAQNR